MYYHPPSKNIGEMHPPSPQYVCPGLELNLGLNYSTVRLAPPEQEEVQVFGVKLW